MRRRGVLLPPSQFEAWFLSTAHTPEDIERIVSASAEAFGEAAPRKSDPEDPSSRGPEWARGGPD
jgi:hypothetical protein